MSPKRAEMDLIPEEMIPLRDDASIIGRFLNM